MPVAVVVGGPVEILPATVAEVDLVWVGWTVAPNGALDVPSGTGTWSGN